MTTELTSTRNLTCQELVELVTMYLEDALSAEERARVDAHLAGCDGCDIYVEQMRQTIAVLGKLGEEHISADAEEKLLNVFRDWKKN